MIDLRLPISDTLDHAETGRHVTRHRCGVLPLGTGHRSAMSLRQDQTVVRTTVERGKLTSPTLICACGRKRPRAAQNSQTCPKLPKPGQTYPTLPPGRGGGFLRSKVLPRTYSGFHASFGRCQTVPRRSKPFQGILQKKKIVYFCFSGGMPWRGSTQINPCRPKSKPNTG
jgi:hypothetical protein